MIIGSPMPGLDAEVPQRRATDSQAKAPDGAWLREMERQQASQWLQPTTQTAATQRIQQAQPAPRQAESLPVVRSDHQPAVARSFIERAPSAQPQQDREPSPSMPADTLTGPALATASQAPATPSFSGHGVKGSAGQQAAAGQYVPAASTAGTRTTDSGTPSNQAHPVDALPMPNGSVRPAAMAYAAQLAQHIESAVRADLESASAVSPAFAAPRGHGPRVHVVVADGVAHLWLGLDAPAGDALVQATLLLPQLRRHVEATGHRLGRVTCNGTVLPHAGASRPSSPHAFDDMLSAYPHPARQERP